MLGGMVMSVLCCTLTFAFALGLWRGIPGHMTRETGEVNTVAYNIAEFNLPSGYTPDYALNLVGFSLAAYQGDDSHSHLTLMQAPNWVYSGTMTSVGSAQNRDLTRELTVVSNEQRVVRNQDVTVTISEGTNGEGMPYRQLLVAFEGKGGTALLVMNETVSQWDGNDINSFLNSFR
jgi:hypothetical protein